MGDAEVRVVRDPVEREFLHVQGSIDDIFGDIYAVRDALDEGRGLLDAIGDQLADLSGRVEALRSLVEAREARHEEVRDG